MLNIINYENQLYLDFQDDIKDLRKSFDFELDAFRDASYESQSYDKLFPTFSNISTSIIIY